MDGGPWTGGDRLGARREDGGGTQGAEGIHPRHDGRHARAECQSCHEVQTGAALAANSSEISLREPVQVLRRHRNVMLVALGYRDS